MSTPTEMSGRNELDIWMGLAEVVPLPGCKRLGNGKGAFVKVALWADSDSDFRAKVEKAISELDLQLLELEDREPINKVLNRTELGDETLQMLDTVRTNRSDVIFGTFHIWKKTDA